MEQLSLLDDVRALLAAREHEGIRGLAGRVPAATWAELAPRLDGREVAALIQWLPEDELSAVLAELHPEAAAAILRTLSQSAAADLLQAMAPDDAADVVEELPAQDAEYILTRMAPAEAQEIRDLLAYPPDSAGGMMTPAFVAVTPDLEAAETVAALRRVAAEAETIYYTYVIDAGDHLLGVLSLHNLVLTRPDTLVREVMVADPIRIQADADRETAARLLTDYRLLAIPVVDTDDRLLGIITQDDVAEILDQAATEDIERLGGSQPLETPYLQASIPLLIRRRVVWLLLLFAAEAYTGTVLRAFDSEISQVVALAYFIPLLIGTGGNIGSQTTTTLVRAIGLGEVQLRDVGRVLAKEIVVGVVLGAIMAVVAFGRAELLATGRDVAMVVALTIAAICVWSATVAAVLPLLLRRLRIDPAVVSAPLITTLVDGTGLVIYFTIAKYLLRL